MTQDDIIFSIEHYTRITNMLIELFQANFVGTDFTPRVTICQINEGMEMY